MKSDSQWRLYMLGLAGLLAQPKLSYLQRKTNFLWAWNISLPLAMLFSGLNFAVYDLPKLAFAEFLLAAFLLIPARALIYTLSSLIWAEYLLLGFALLLSWALALYGGYAGSGLLWIFAFPFLSYWLVGQFHGNFWNVAWILGLNLLPQLSPYVHAAYQFSQAYWLQLSIVSVFYVGWAAILNFRYINTLSQVQTGVNDQSELVVLPQLISATVFHDPVTGLPNRLKLLDLLQQELAAAAGHEQGLLVIHIRLQKMFELANLLGTGSQDELIRQVLRTMQANVGSRGSFSRIRRDEFICLYRNNLVHLKNWQLIQEMLSFQLEYRNQNFAIPITYSCGIAAFPLHGVEPDSLVQKAELAMLHAQFSGQRIAMYDSSLEAQLQRSHYLFEQLQEALNRGNLSLHYQGQVDLHSGHLIGAEALARWFDAVQGAVSPLEFIPVAERSGLIKPFTLWVLRQGLSDLARWHSEGLDISLSINISARSITDTSLVDAIYALLEEFKIPPRKLILELTEASFSESPDLARQTILALKQLGVQLSIDDFGTGYSSLSYLKDLPLHELKIDQSFVKGLLLDHSCQAIVQSTIQLAHNLSLRVVAEGIENPRTEIQLRELGCDFGQGYWYGKPMPAEVFRQWCGNNQTPQKLALYD